MIEQGSATYPARYIGRHRSQEQPTPNAPGNAYDGRRRAPETPPGALTATVAPVTAPLTPEGVIA